MKFCIPGATAHYERMAMADASRNTLASIEVESEGPELAVAFRADGCDIAQSGARITNFAEQMSAFVYDLPDSGVAFVNVKHECRAGHSVRARVQVTAPPRMEQKHA